MATLTAGDASRVLDAVAVVGEETDPSALPGLAARLSFDLVPVDRAGWVAIDPRHARLRGTHWPKPIPQLLEQLPRDFAEIPLVPQLSSGGAPDALRISDVWTRREWHATRLWADLYGPSGGEYQLAARVWQNGSVVNTLSLFRSDRDFSSREVAVVREFSRHLSVAARRLAPHPPPSGLTARQTEILRALESGDTVRQAATRLGISPKTVENHLQDAYRQLGVTNRIAALRKLG